MIQWVELVEEKGEEIWDRGEGGRTVGYSLLVFIKYYSSMHDFGCPKSRHIDDRLNPSSFLV